MQYVDINMHISGRVSLTNLVAMMALVEEYPYATQIGGEGAAQAIEEPEPAKPAATRTRKKAEAAPDPEMLAELAAENAQPEPAGARAVVDAGTGKPIQQTDDGEAVEMTFDEVKAKATKLAAADMNKLAEILGKYGAKKLSEVPEESLGDFAGDVIAALG